MSFLDKAFRDFNKLNIMVIGDVMIDSYIWGKVDRISPEAPVPIVNVLRREFRMGGAANVALNLKALGATPLLISMIGNDPDGEQMLNLMKKEGFDAKGIYKSSFRPTTIKHRILGGSQQLLRIDSEETALPVSNEREELKKRISDNLDSCQAVVFEDYDKGVIDEEIIAFTVAECKKRNIPTAVDPKKRNFLNYKGVDLFKPNLKEIKEGLNINVDPKNKKSISRASRLLKEELGHKLTLLTLSEYGVYLDGEEETSIPAHRREISDVSGAGDTVISIATCCLALGLREAVLAELSNLGGGLVCEHLGVVPIDKSQLLDEAIRHLDPASHGLV